MNYVDVAATQSRVLRRVQETSDPRLAAAWVAVYRDLLTLENYLDPQKASKDKQEEAK